MNTSQPGEDIAARSGAHMEPSDLDLVWRRASVRASKSDPENRTQHIPKNKTQLISET